MSNFSTKNYRGNEYLWESGNKSELQDICKKPSPDPLPKGALIFLLYKNIRKNIS